VGHQRKNQHLREGQGQGLRHENVNVIEKKEDGNDLKHVKGDEKEDQGEWACPARCMQASFPLSKSWHNRRGEMQGLPAP
jgi:hypothetical protein